MYLTQLALLSLLVASQTSMSKRIDEVQSQLDMEQFDCVSTGEKWRAYKSEAFKVLAGKVDDSGSSLADHLLGIDMGGPAVGAPPFPPANQRDGQSMRRLHRKRAKQLFDWWVRHLASKTLTDMLAAVGSPKNNLHRFWCCSLGGYSAHASQVFGLGKFDALALPLSCA